LEAGLRGQLPAGQAYLTCKASGRRAFCGLAAGIWAGLSSAFWLCCIST